jgi:RNA polymerase II subunit A small phosphatase-like protein
VKDLSALGRDLKKTVLVDNNPFSFILQPVNGIPCVPFTGEQPEDRQVGSRVFWVDWLAFPE